MDVVTAAVLGGVVGLALALTVVALGRRSRRPRREATLRMPGSTGSVQFEQTLPDGVSDVLSVLRSSGIVLDSADKVVNSSPSAVSHGLVRGNDLVHAQLLDLAREVRRDGEIREVELELSRGPQGRGATMVVGARVAPLRDAHILLMVEDHSQERRLEEIRRDFVANVSHELKTPIGGIALLSEAVLDAHDDPEAVSRFARRMRVESTRLTRLVQDIVDLSRLQVADTLSEPARIDMARVAREAADQTRLAAEDKKIRLAVAVGEGTHDVWGDGELLTTAVRNLAGNAIAYSEAGTRVTVAVDSTDDVVTVAVTDQGQGIPLADQQRIFERFYRVDGARSRSTGGTGLGLSIVKHVCANHGGEVSVWSEPGHGSTFTMRLPAATVAQPQAGYDDLPPAAASAASAPEPEPIPVSREVS